MTSSFAKLARATSTPLASIFGSGFLVIVPILAGAVGPYAVFAMMGVCGLAYAVGSVIRFNIHHSEPLLANKPSEVLVSLERMSDLALILAYIISVSLYLHILSAFVLGGVGIDNELNEDLLTSAIIVLITVIGMWRGLDSLEFLEQWGLGITLLIILVLLLGFGRYDWLAWQSADGLVLTTMPVQGAWATLTVIAGTLIVVQGFETSRYLGATYDAPTRVLSSRLAQIVATVVYLVFIALATPMVHLLQGDYGDSSLIQLTRFLSPFMVIPLITAAVLSQFSAAVADTLAATGNLEELTHQKLKERFGYLFVGAGALVLCWSANTIEIIALASRAFAFYYLIQCVVAITVTDSRLRQFCYGTVGLALAFITVFAVPAS